MLGLILAAADVEVSVGGVIIGLLLAALVYFLGVWLAGETGAAVLRVIGAIVAVLIFVVCAFEFYG